MVVHIGVDCHVEGWKTCLMENERTLEVCTFTDAAAALTYLKHLCALYPEPVIAVAADMNACFAPIAAISEREWDAMLSFEGDESVNKRIKEFLIDIGSINLHSYCIPPVARLSGIPLYRRWHRRDMGDAGSLCAVASIMYRMRMQEAAWSEMHFLYLEVGQESRTIVVVENGTVVNGVNSKEFASSDDVLRRVQSREEMLEMRDMAFWEGLTQDVAGLLAVHHIEDIVVREQSAAEESVSRKDAVIERLEEQYQLYQFPRPEGEQAAFDVAVGAALLAGGLAGSGHMAEVVERLGIRVARSDTLHVESGTGSAPLRSLS